MRKAKPKIESKPSIKNMQNLTRDLSVSAGQSQRVAIDLVSLAEIAQVHANWERALRSNEAQKLLVR